MLNHYWSGVLLNRISYIKIDFICNLQIAGKCFLNIKRRLCFLCYVVCKSHDTAGSLAHGVFISTPNGNPDPLAKSRPTGKIQTHWLGQKVAHIVTLNIQKLKSCFHQYFIYIHKFNKTMAYKENCMVDRCMRRDFCRCDPSRITLDLRPQVIWLGLQLKESFLTHLSTIRFSLNTTGFS